MVADIELNSIFPVWDKLSPEQKRELEHAASPRTAAAGELIHGAGAECVGLLAIRSGRLRAYMLSESGREITLYRLFERDICLFSASCMVKSLQFDICIEAETDSDFLVISPEIYRSLMDRSAPLANYTNEIMASRFSEVMWLVEQVLWKSFDRRLASFLMRRGRALRRATRSPSRTSGSPAHLGTAREVVTRMLRYFQSEGLVSLARGEVRILDRKALSRLAG